MTNTQPQPIHLVGQDADDLIVMSSLLQDALIRHADMTFESRRRRFVAVLSRFRWEMAPKVRERVRAGLHFNHVFKVQYYGMALQTRDAVSELLAVKAEPGEDDGVTITLEFAGGGAIRLAAECVDAEFRDLGASWQANRVPDHSEAG
jgi:hypothetical protein